jgi:hypothetical protein
MGGAPSRAVPPLTEAEGEEQLMAALGDVRDRLDPRVDLRVEVCEMVSLLEQRRACRGDA